MLGHMAFDGLAWLAAILVGWRVRRTWLAQAALPMPDRAYPLYIVIVWIGAIAAAMLLASRSPAAWDGNSDTTANSLAANNGNHSMEQKIEALSAEDAARVDKQRGWVRDHYDSDARHHYDAIEGKLRLLETIVLSNWIEPSETWKLRSLGITFGDALAQKLGLSWVAVEDEHGRDPALHEQGTSIVLFPLTMISKRIERGEKVDVRNLFDDACRTIDQLRAKLTDG